MRIPWFPEAARNLTAQLERNTERDPWVAIDVGDAVQAAVGRLADHPSIGRPGHVPLTRELMVGGTPYIVGSRIEPDVVLVLRVLHGAQRWAPA